MPFALPVNRAVKKIAEHAELVAQHLGKPLHEASVKEIKIATVDSLRNHPEFAINPTSGLNAVKNGKTLYCAYELGHRLLVDRLISKLKSEGNLSEEHAPEVSKLFGILYYNPPALVLKKQLTALNKLEKQLGREKTEILLGQIQKEWNDTKNEGFTKDESQYERELSDLFSNPKSNMLVFWLNFREKHETPIEKLRTKLQHYMGTAKETYYKTR